MKRLVSILLCCVLIITATACQKPEVPLTAAELLDLGEKYLLELDYEQALVQFLKVIEVEPMNARAYLAAAEAYLAMGDEEKAIAILQQGLEQIPTNQDIIKMLDGLLYERQRTVLAQESNQILTELASLCAVQDYDKVFERMQTDSFAKIAELSKFLNRPYIAETEYGKIGVYEVNSEKYGNFMIYYGDYRNYIREGSGVWLGYFDGNNYFANCEWKSDIPNGDATVREWNTGLNESVVYRLISGHIINGFWDGDVNWNFEREAETSINMVYFDNGKWIVTGTTHSEKDPYVSGDIYLDDNDLLILRGIIGYGE